MKRAEPGHLTVEQLLERFTTIALQQYEALLMDETGKYNRLFDRMEKVKAELGSREGDQRRALLRLFEHPNAQVRLKAAIATLGLEPDAARHVLQMIRERREYPQALYAGMALRALDDGTFKPS